MKKLFLKSCSTNKDNRKAMICKILKMYTQKEIAEYDKKILYLLKFLIKNIVLQKNTTSLIVLLVAGLRFQKYGFKRPRE